MPSLRTNRAPGEVISSSDMNAIVTALNTILSGTEFSNAAKDIVGALIAAAGGSYNSTTKAIFLPGVSVDNSVIGDNTTWSSNKINTAINALVGSTALTKSQRDTVGTMVAAAGGTYNSTAGTITLPSGGGAAINDGSNLSSTTASTAQPWSASNTQAQILGLINDATSSATTRVWSASKIVSYVAANGGGNGGGGGSASLDAGAYGFAPGNTAAANATALFNAVTAAGKRRVTNDAGGRCLLQGVNFTNEDVVIDMPDTTFVHPLNSTDPVITVERVLGSPISVGPTRVVEWGPRNPGGTSWSARYTAIDITSSGLYKNYKAGDLVLISSKDHYPWDWDANKYDIATQDPGKGTFQQEFLPLVGIGLQVDNITNGGPREQMQVTGSTSGATGLIAADLVGNALGGITATSAHITFTTVSGDFVNGETLTRVAGGNPDGGSGTFATVGQAVGTVSGAPMLLVNKLLDYQYGRTTAAQTVTGTATPLDTTGTVRIRLVDRSKACSIRANFDIEGTAGDQDKYLTSRTDTLKFRGVFMPHFEGRFFGSWTRAVIVTSCFEGRFRAVFDGLPNHAYLDNNAFGYGYECKAASQGNIFELVGRNLRHSFTTNPNPRTWASNDQSYIDYGTPMDNVVQNSYAAATYTNSFDTHPGDIRTRFVNCHAIAGGSAGRYNSDGGAQFASRGFGTKWIGCHSYNSVEGINILGTQYDAGFAHTYVVRGCDIDQFQSRGLFIADSISANATLEIESGRIMGDGSVTNRQYQHEAITIGKGVKVIIRDVHVGGFNAFPIRMREAGTAGILSELDIVSMTLNYRNSTANAQGIRVDGTLGKANIDGISLLLPDGHGLGGLVTNRAGNTAFKVGSIKQFGVPATSPIPIFQTTSAAGSPTYASLVSLIAAGGGTSTPTHSTAVAPTVAAGSNAPAGTTVVFTAGSTDVSGEVVLTTSTTAGTGGGQMAVVTFGTAFGSNTFPVVTGVLNSINRVAGLSAHSATSFTIGLANAVGASAEYKFTYYVPGV